VAGAHEGGNGGDGRAQHAFQALGGLFRAASGEGLGQRRGGVREVAAEVPQQRGGVGDEQRGALARRDGGFKRFGCRGRDL
jgi:hypothetical protein